MSSPAGACPRAKLGTFRGNNLAFVAGSAALALWRSPEFELRLRAHTIALDAWLVRICERHAGLEPTPRGRGLLRGLAFADRVLAKQVSRAAFELGVLIETSGASGEVLKLMPPLTIDPDALASGLTTLERALPR